MSYLSEIAQWFIHNLLVLDIGVLIGMLITAWFVGSKGCYEECLLSDKHEDDNTSEYWVKRLGRREGDRE